MEIKDILPSDQERDDSTQSSKISPYRLQSRRSWNPNSSHSTISYLSSPNRQSSALELTAAHILCAKQGQLSHREDVENTSTTPNLHHTSQLVILHLLPLCPSHPFILDPPSPTLTSIITKYIPCLNIKKLFSSSSRLPIDSPTSTPTF